VFQCSALASGLVAAPASPIPDDLASGAIVRKGTAVLIWAFNSGKVKTQMQKKE